MMRIQTLDPQLANQIAAGEVVERPASVVKELVENSLDAGATKIVVEIEQGGHDVIRVRDNGKGIHKDDLSLALCRHATSKIHSFDDLMAVISLGFRGEALASIAAVSRLKIISCQENSDSAFGILAEGGHISQEPIPFAHPVGTTVEVRDLFFNTPARKKFMRQPKTEFTNIEAIVERLALSHINTSIVLKHNDKVVFQSKIATSDAQQEQSIAAILGNEFMQNALGIEFNAAGLQLKGSIGLPTYSRAQADTQYFYINGRFVRDKLLMHAVREAYHDVLFHGRHPVYVLYLSIDPTMVDVNVHPTKHEVRFRDSRVVHDFIRKGIANAIEQINPEKVLEKVSVTPQEKSENFYYQNSDVNANRHSRESGNPVFSSILDSRFRGNDGGVFRGKDGAVPSSREPSQQVMSLKVQEQMESYQKLHPPIAATETASPTEYPLGYAIGQIHNIFIVAENKQGMVVVDMHAAHERILFEKLKIELESQQIAKQVLLLPLTINLSKREMHDWEACQADLAMIGISSDAVGPQSIVIREIPMLLKKYNIEQLLRDVLADMATQDKSQRVRMTLDAMLGNIACKAAIKAHHPLAIHEMNAILREMETTPKSSCCNHGRPTWVQLTTEQLDKFFLRGQ